MQKLTYGSVIEVARATKEQKPENPSITKAYTELVLMSDGTILKRRVVSFVQKADEYEPHTQTYKWRVKRKPMSYPFITKEVFVEGFKANGYQVEVSG